MKSKIKTGFRSGKLTAISVSHRKTTDCGGVLTYWNCKCDCGNESTVTNRNLLYGHTRSCGCLPKKPITHGFARKDAVHPIHQVWRRMTQRCGNPNDRNYHRYGGRGVKVCEEWLDFSNFARDMAVDWVEGLSIERIDNNGNYCKENCRWATVAEQASNRRSNVRITHNGETLIASEWSKRTHLPAATIIWRFRQGWPTEHVLSTEKHVCRTQNI